MSKLTIRRLVIGGAALAISAGLMTAFTTSIVYTSIIFGVLLVFGLLAWGLSRVGDAANQIPQGKSADSQQSIPGTVTKAQKQATQEAEKTGEHPQAGTRY